MKSGWMDGGWVDKWIDNGWMDDDGTYDVANGEEEKQQLETLFQL